MHSDNISLIYDVNLSYSFYAWIYSECAGVLVTWETIEEEVNSLVVGRSFNVEFAKEGRIRVFECECGDIERGGDGNDIDDAYKQEERVGK